MKPYESGKTTIDRKNFDEAYTGGQSNHSFSLVLPSGKKIIFHPNKGTGTHTHEALLHYEEVIVLPQSDYRDVLPFQEALNLPGMIDKWPIFTEVVKKKKEEMNKLSTEIISVPVILKDNQLYLRGDKHHTFVAALLCQRPVLLKKAPPLMCRFAPPNSSWYRVVWIKGVPRKTNISKTDVLNEYNDA